MPQETSWYVENRVLRTRLYDVVTEEELANSGKESTELMKSAQPPLFLLIDTRDVTRFPSNFKRMLERMHRYEGDSPVDWTIVLSGNSLLNFFGQMVTRVLPTPFQIFRTLDEAEAFIAHNAPDLAPLLPMRNEA